jgi:GNAT superfamily N-acetyltransferase
MENAMIRRCGEEDFEAIHGIINDAARAYEGVIPADSWKQPYMAEDELRHEIAQGIAFWGYQEEGPLEGVMGIQPVDDVTLIRHAYVRTECQGKGIGGKLLDHLRAQAGSPLLIGTWADAVWAVRFYERRGFRLVTAAEKERLLRRYWSIPERQIEPSVVLADELWWGRRGGES